MGAWDLTYDCNASSFEDVVVYFEKLIEEQEKEDMTETIHIVQM